MNTFILLALFSGIAVAACLFAAGYFFFVNNEGLIHLTLGTLFLAIGLRIGKSIFYYLYPEMSSFGVALGFLGLSSLGPTLLLHTLLSNELRTSFFKWDLLHFIIPIVGFFGIWFELNWIVPYYTYSIGTGILLIYIVVIARVTFVGNTNRKGWNFWLLGGVSVLFTAFAYQLFSDSMLNYANGAAVASVVVYTLIFWMLKNPGVFQRRRIFEIHPELIKRIVESLEGEQYYQKPALNLSQFAQHMNEPMYLVSKAVKRHYGRNFPEVINALRIKEVKQRLIAEKDEFNKVEGIAFDVGFNTPSAFYAAFKKETSSTPREYQKSLIG